jgi:hypothetical protein
MAPGRRAGGQPGHQVHPAEPARPAGHLARRLASLARVLGISWLVEWFGLGLIIFARIMRVSADMRADLVGTV